MSRSLPVASPISLSALTKVHAAPSRYKIRETLSSSTYCGPWRRVTASANMNSLAVVKRLSVGGLATVRRHGGRALRWLALGVFVVAATVGLLFITRGTAVHRVRGVGADGAPVAPAEPAFPLTVTLLTGAPIVAGNRVELALNGDGTFPRLWADLRAARRSITVQMYYLGPGAVADTLAAILAERARAGVAVRMLYDAFGSTLPAGYYDRLRAAGVRAVAFRPLRFRNLWVVQNRSHVRGIVVDSRIGWTGGFGIDDKWLGGGRREGEWRETNARFEGPGGSPARGGVRRRVGGGDRGAAHRTGDAGYPRGRRGAGRAAVHGTNPRKHPGRTVPRALHRRRTRATVHHQCVLRAGRQLPRLAGPRGPAWRGRPGPLGGPSTDVAVARTAGHARYEAMLEAGARVFDIERRRFTPRPSSWTGSGRQSAP